MCLPTLSIVCQLAQAIGKLPVRVKRDVPGFMGNRLLREAIHIVEQDIATAEQVDLVAKMTLGLRSGRPSGEHRLGRA